MSHATPIEAAAVPPHMVDRLTSAAQRKVFGNLAGALAPEPVAKPPAKKATKRKK